MPLHDPLTGLPTSHLLLERTREVLRLADRRESRVALVAWRPLDPDTGAPPEDGETRDRVIVANARGLRDGLRASDLIGRTGDSEFVLVLPGLDDEAGLLDALDRLSRSGSRQPGRPDRSDGLAHHAGAALYPEHGARVEELLERARAALEEATREDREVVVFRRTEAGEGEAGPPLPDPGSLRAAVQDGDLTLVYQPVVQLSDRSTAGMEALLRMPGPDDTLLPARRVLPSLREHDLTVDADAVVLERVVETLAGWPENRRPGWVSVNLAVETVSAEGFADRLAGLLADASLDARRLTVELAAEDARRDPEGIRTAMAGLRRAGVGIALDDVGAGPLPLAPLGHRPLHYVKVDPAAIRNLQEDAARAALVEGLVGLGHALGARVVAEGVESEEELRRVTEAGCDLAQGFYLGEPRPSRELTLPPPR